MNLFSFVTNPPSQIQFRKEKNGTDYDTHKHCKTEQADTNFKMCS